ncbi:MAG: FAD:protein FMN transferase, partial [Oscillospiraceae bacterium]|nr:FAD:protein FMN transferase [Oscillospiraceae bacterium]
NIAVYTVVDAWGFYSGDHRVPGGEELQALLPLTDPALVTVRDGTVTLSADGMAIDLGGIAKGYASAAAADAVRKAGASSAILSLGGNVYAVGKKPDGTAWKVGVQDPKDTASLVGILSLEDEAAVTSGAYQRYFEAGGVRYHHIIDPETLFPREGCVSVTVVTRDSALADALSTGLFNMTPEEGLALVETLDGTEALWRLPDGSAVASPGFGGLLG